MNNLNKKISIFSFFIFITTIIGFFVFQQQYNKQQQAVVDKFLSKIACEKIPSQDYLRVIEDKEEQRIIRELYSVNKSFVEVYRDLINAPDNKKSELAVKLQATLQKRKPLLIDTMSKNPSAAFPIIEQDQRLVKSNSDILSSCMAKAEVVTGELDRRHFDFQHDEHSNSLFAQFFDYIVTPDGEEIRLHKSGIKEFFDQNFAKNVKVIGYRLDDEFIFDSENVNNYFFFSDIGEELGKIVSKANAQSKFGSSTGEQRLLVILFNFSNSNSRIDAAGTRSLLQRNIVDYYTETSYGKSNFNMTVVGPVKLDIPRSCRMGLIRSSAVKAVDSQVNFANFDRLLVIGPLNCGWRGMASSPDTYRTGEGVVKLSSSHVKLEGSQPPPGTPSHELGHNLGVGHAGMENGSSIIEYGDLYDVMGRSNNLGHFNAVHKDKLNFFEASNLLRVTQSGRYTIEPIETPTTGVKGIRIGKYYVEYRKPIGFDTNAVGPVSVGSLIHEIRTGRGADSVLLLNNGQHSVRVGETFTRGGVTIKTISADMNGLCVEVVMGGVPASGDCTDAPPVVPINQIITVPSLTPTPTLHIAVPTFVCIGSADVCQKQDPGKL